MDKLQNVRYVSCVIYRKVGLGEEANEPPVPKAACPDDQGCPKYGTYAARCLPFTVASVVVAVTFSMTVFSDVSVASSVTY